MKVAQQYEFQPLNPRTELSNFERSLSFYTQLLPFSVDFQRPEHRFAFLGLQGSQIMIEQQNGHWETAPLAYPYGWGINPALQVDDLDVVLRPVKSHEYPIKLSPEENWYRMNDEVLGNKEVLIVDPDGYLLRFLQHLGSRALSTAAEST